MNKLKIWLTIIAMTSTVLAQQPTSANLISNNILVLAGSRDTICLIAQGQTKTGLNYSVDNGKTWEGSVFGNALAPVDLVFGNGRAVVPFIEIDETHKSSLFSVNLLTGNTENKNITWNYRDTSYTYDFRIKDAIFLSNEYFFAVQDGGILRFNPRSKSLSVKAYKPGNSKGFATTNFSPDSGLKPDTLKRTIAVSGFTTDSGNTVLLVTTPEKIWFFSPLDSTWDTLSNEFDLAGSSFRSFSVATSSPDGKLIFAFVNTTNGTSQQTELIRYNMESKKWITFFTEAPAIMSVINKHLYTIEKNNSIGLYSVVDTVYLKKPLPLIAPQLFIQRMTNGNLAEYPLYINDILYLPSNDSTGNLWIASSQGLYLSEGENVGRSITAFKTFRYIPKISPGLKKVYAYPGIINSCDYAQDYTNCFGETRFAYNLEKDAKVTIEIYDYNMDLVKSVIRNQSRRAGYKTSSGKSTDDIADVWDGSNRFGKTVAPGVYYFKITTDAGERAFGKIIVAK